MKTPSVQASFSLYRRKRFYAEKTDCLALYTKEPTKMLRYAGGKTRAVKHLLPRITATEVVSPFLGGGSVELALGKNNVRVFAADVLAPLIDFYTMLKTNRQALLARLRELHPFTKELYVQCKATLDDPDPLSRAVKFFIVNRCCYSGCMTGGYTAVRSPISCIDNLEAIDLTNLDVRCCDYETLLTEHPTTFAYLDPPYDVPNLYLSNPFDHERLAALLHARQSDWVLCYNDTPRIRALYADCDITPVSWAYGMNASRRSNEIIIRPRS